ncbi:MAG: hypothetical protein M3133_04910, partial [Actinomycetota bacterium]|nr:hypothetical protein [Actinomycetota bacterium]
LGRKEVSAEVALADGRRIRTVEVRGVLNRLASVPLECLARVALTDREYASQEVHALLMSWLAAFRCPVLNRPTPSGLSGPWLHQSEWSSLAVRAGLPAAPYAQTSRDSPVQLDAVGRTLPARAARRALLVVGEDVVGPAAPEEIVFGCRRLGELAGTDLLGVEFGIDRWEGWAFLAATPLPELSPGGEVLLDVLAAALRSGEVGPVGPLVRDSV